MTININGTTGISGVDGSAGTPAIQGSDTNTGVFFGTNTIDLSTDGTSRLSIGADGDLNVDSGTLFVDASTNQVGIGTTSPSEEFVVRADAPSIQLESSNASGRTHGIQSNSDGNFFIYDGTAGVNRITLDSSGNAGIGTTSPDDLLHLSASNSGIGSDFTLANNILRFEDTDITQATGQVIGGFLFEGQDIDTGAAGLQVALTANVAGGTGGGELRFYTAASGDTLDGSDTERMRIHSNGKITVRTTNITNDAELTLSAPLNSGDPTLNCTVGLTAGNVDTVIFRDNSGHTCGAINVNAGTNTTSYGTSSDYRLKENVVPLTGAIERLNQLQVKRFNFISEPETIFDGFLAHEAQEVVPECATHSKDAVDAEGNPVYQNIDQSKLVPLLTAALQESITKIQTLEARLSVLEGGAN